MRFNASFVVGILTIGRSTWWLAESFLMSRGSPSIALAARFKPIHLQAPLKTPETYGSRPSNHSHVSLSPLNSTQFFAAEAQKVGDSSKRVPPANKVSTNWSPFGVKKGGQQKSWDREVPVFISSDSPTVASASNTPGVVDLNRNLELLRSELEEKNQRFRDTVHNLQSESERTLASVQQWDQYYRTKMDDLANKAIQADQTLQTREQHYQSQVLQLQQESTKKDFTAADKVYWLAQQLQQFKFQAHQQELEDELAACNKHLRTKLEKLQEDLDSQVKLTEAERAKHGVLWRQRIDLETEVAAIQKELQDSIQNLKARLNDEQENRRRDKQLHQDQLAEKEASFQERLREMRGDAETRTTVLPNNLQGNYYDATLRMIQNEASSEANETLMSEPARLLSLLRQKEKELEQQLVLVKEANDKANGQWTKRMNLESQLSSMKHEYDKSVNEWRKKFEDLETVRSREVSALKSLLSQREADAAAQMRASTQELETKKAAYERDLKAKDEHYGLLMREMELVSENEKRNLNQTLVSIRNDFEQFKSENDHFLSAEKASFQSKQDELRLLLTQKETELLEQSALTSSMEKETEKQRQRIEEVETELANIRFANETATTQWMERVASLQQERISQEDRLNKLLSDAEEAARAKLTEADLKMEEQKREMKKSRDEMESRLLQELQLLKEATRLKEEQANITMNDLLSDRSAFEFAAQKAIDEAKAEVARKHRENEETVAAFQHELREQEALAEKHERDFITVSAEKRKLDEELKSMKNELFRAVQEGQRLRDSVASTTDEFLRFQSEHELLLATERQKLEAKHDNLLSIINAKKEELLKLSDLCSATEETAKLHWERRTKLEKELAALKHTHDSSIAEWEDRFNTLQRKRIAEQQRMEALLAQTKEQTRIAIEAIRRDAEEKALALEESLEKNSYQLRLDHQQLVEAFERKELDTNATINALKAEIAAQRIASNEKLAAALNSSQARQKELISLLATKEIQYHEQVKLASAAENRTRVEAAQRMHLEAELTTAKNNFEGHVAQWESRYNSLLESRDRALQRAEALIARKETDSRAVVDALSREVEAAKEAYEEGMRQKDQEVALQLRDVKARSDKKLMELHQELQEVSGSYQQFKAEARELIDQLNREADEAKANFVETLKAKDEDMTLRIQGIRALSDKKLRETQQELLSAIDKHELYKAKTETDLTSKQEAWNKMEKQLRSQVQKKEEELAAMSVVRRSTADEVLLVRSKKRKGFQRSEALQPDRTDLENQLVALKKKYEFDATEWETRYRTLQEEHQSARAIATAPSTTPTPDLNIKVVSEEAKVRQRELKSEIQAQAARHSKEIQKLMNASKTREAELKQQLFLLEGELQAVEAMAQRDLDAERTASLAKQVELVEQIEQSQRHLDKVLGLLANERAKSRRPPGSGSQA